MDIFNLTNMKRTFAEERKQVEAQHQEEMPEYNFAQLRLLIHALEMLDTSEYDLGYTETYRYLIERFRKQLKQYEC